MSETKKLNEHFALKVMRYGYNNPTFKKVDLQNDLNMTDEDFNNHWGHCEKLVSVLGDDSRCLTPEIIAIYMQYLSFEQAKKEAARAYTTAVIAIIVSILIGAATIAVTIVINT